MDTSTNVMRVYEHYVGTNAEGIRQILMKRVLKIEDSHEGALARRIRNRPHSAVSTDLTKNLLLIDKEDVHIYDIESAIKDGMNSYVATRVETKHDVNITGVQLISDRYMYCLYNKKGTRSAKISMSASSTNTKIDSTIGQNGLGLIDLDGIEENIERSLAPMPIVNTICGANAELVFSEINQKLVFVENYHNIKMVPLLHQNVINFEGQKSKDQYLIFKQIHDRFIALDKQNQLITWSMETGNLLEIHRLPAVSEMNFKDYEVVNC